MATLNFFISFFAFLFDYFLELLNQCLLSVLNRTRYELGIASNVSFAHDGPGGVVIAVGVAFGVCWFWRCLARLLFGDGPGGFFALGWCR